MMTLYIKKAVEDIRRNRFLNIVTIVTVSLATLIVAAFILFFINASELLNAWQKDIRITAYLKPGIAAAQRADLKRRIKALDGVQHAHFVSKDAALARLKRSMPGQSFLFEHLAQNPLPDAFEIRMRPAARGWAKIKTLAAAIAALPAVDEVEYGQRWLGRLAGIFNLFKLTGYALGAIFFMATVFIVANTIRLVIYARREEVEIMRLVGAADGFIKIPFYILGLIQGAAGAVVGLAALLTLFYFISSNVDRSFFSNLFHFRFLSFQILLLFVLGSMMVGWLGSYLSLKQFLKV